MVVFIKKALRLIGSILAGLFFVSSILSLYYIYKHHVVFPYPETHIVVLDNYNIGYDISGLTKNQKCSRVKSNPTVSVGPDLPFSPEWINCYRGKNEIFQYGISTVGYYKKESNKKKKSNFNFKN